MAVTPWQSDASTTLARLLFERKIKRKPLKRPTVRGAARYVGRHGLLHAIKDRSLLHGRLELRYVTDTELAALGLVAS